MKIPEVRANILLVNDRPDQLIALATVLGPLQENLVLARSGEEALRQLLHHEFAVVLLDVHMPGLDGFQTASLIRQRRRSRSTPIIFLTAYGQRDDQVTRSYSLGAVDFIQTPVVPEILCAKVSVFVQLYKKSEELRLITETQHQRELDEAREKLEAETKRNLFFVLSIDLLAVAGFDGYFKQTNPAWEKVLGWSEEELKSRAFFDFAHPQDRTATLNQLETLKRGTAITYFEHRFACREGNYKWLGWTAAPFAAEQLIYIFARDITERRLAEEEIR
jgi:PAS domain S-box-containing protein